MARLRSSARIQKRERRTLCILVFVVILIFVLVHLGLNIEETVHCRTFMSVLLWN